MDLQTIIRDDLIVIYPEGTIDHNNASAFECGVLELIEKYPDNNILFNLKDLEFISSAGLIVFIYTCQQLKKIDKKVFLSNVNELIMELIKVISADKIIDIFKSEEEVFAPCV